MHRWSKIASSTKTKQREKALEAKASVKEDSNQLQLLEKWRADETFTKGYKQSIRIELEGSLEVF